MKRREWDPKTKAQIVLQGLKGTPVSELCNEHRISQTQYYQWRDQFLAAGAERLQGKAERTEVDELRGQVASPGPASWSRKVAPRRSSPAWRASAAVRS